MSLELAVRDSAAGRDIGELVHRLAEAAEEVAEGLRPLEHVPGDIWVDAEWLASTLADLDLDIALYRLRA